jgi:ABC-type transport system substrate-binding protein
MVFGYDPGVTDVPYDPAEATRLLAMAGFGSGFELEMAHGSSWGPIADAIAEDLGKIGVRVTTESMTLGELIARARSGTLPMMLYGRTPTTGDAEEFFDSSLHSVDPARGFGGENFSGFSDPATDALLEGASREMDPERRREYLQRAQRRVLDELPILPITVWWDYVGVSSRVTITIRHDAWLWAAAFRWAD